MGGVLTLIIVSNPTSIVVVLSCIEVVVGVLTIQLILGWMMIVPLPAVNSFENTLREVGFRK